MTLFYAALMGALAVAFGAFGAHALKSMLSPDVLATFETGVRYQMYHALALLALGAARFQSKGILFLFIGTLIFSGSLYVLALTGIKVLGAITPIGGVLQIVGWVMVALDARRARM
ncbi:DUF423 domain-containing protein [Deinococcus roseus]|uniref:DUF423 domain-containing protein n=1 Tax=Deinococcus roseus TaxID=392414 RepID=A0ABQ2CSZ4_9DEIO|nr:DUF423 domain-containing protein [Deinococcus roseus]GGJ17913.1 DUF423 domain-containing protein [Deinococcus roseus]